MDELIKQLDIRGMSWRSLLLAGVLPAALFLLCLRWYSGGWEGCRELIETLGSFKTQWKTISQMLGAFVILSALFVALRAPIFAFYRRLPIPLLHRWSLQRYAGKRRGAELTKERALWMITVARWHERGFDPAAFVADLVKSRVLLPAQTEVQKVSELRRRQVASADRFRLWRLSQLHRTLGWLHVMAATRDAVAKRAIEIAARQPVQSDATNWSQAEMELGFRAPDDWITQELLRWGTLCQTSKRAQTRVASLNRDELYDDYSKAFRISEHFPPAEWIGATSLGNTMAALEDYSTRRYGIDTSLLWSRVEKVIPPSQRDEVYASQVAVYALLNSAAALTVAGLICLVELGLNPPRISEHLLQHSLTLIAASFLTWAFVRFAVYAAGQLRYQMESRVDLYAPRLLAALGLVPKDINERRQMIASLGQFINGAKIDMQNFTLQPIIDPVLSFDKSK
jgi:hypothetical protein